MNSSTDKNNSSTIRKIIFFGLLIVIFSSIINRIFNSPFDFDESINLLVSRIFISTGAYSSFEKIFDPVITTGPTVLIPSALTLVFGNIYLPRLIVFIYSFLLIFIVVTKIIKEETKKIIFLLLLCLTPYYFYYSSHVLGEVPAIFFALTGLYFLSNKKYFLSGLFLMLSIFTKNIFLLSLVPAAYLLFSQRKGITLKHLVHFSLPFIAITIGWEIYKLLTFNFSLHSYYDNLYQLLRYNKGLTRLHPEYFIDRINMLSGTFGVNGVVVILFVISISIYSFFKSNSNLLKSIALFVLVYLFYYFVLGSTSWYRHLFPAIVFFAIILSGIYTSVRLHNIILVILVIILGFTQLKPAYNHSYLYKQNLLPLFDQTADRYFTQSDLLKQQLLTAQYISTNIPNEKIAGFAWYNAPEISYILGKQILKSPEDKDVSYLIRHPFGVEYDSVISNYPNKILLLETPLYKIYKKDD